MCLLFEQSCTVTIHVWGHREPWFNPFLNLMWFKPRHFTSQNTPALLYWGKTGMGKGKGSLAPFFVHCASAAMKLSRNLPLIKCSSQFTALCPGLCLYLTQWHVKVKKTELKQMLAYSSILHLTKVFLEYITRSSRIITPSLCDSLLRFFTLLFKFQGHAA